MSYREEPTTGTHPLPKSKEILLGYQPKDEPIDKKLYPPSGGSNVYKEGKNKNAAKG